MARYQLPNLEVVLIITEWMIDGSRHLGKRKLNKLDHRVDLSNLQPADEKNELEDEENWEEDFRLRVELLVADERKKKVAVCGDIDNLKIRNSLASQDSLRLPDCRLEGPGCDRNPPQSPGLP